MTAKASKLADRSRLGGNDVSPQEAPSRGDRTAEIAPLVAGCEDADPRQIAPTQEIRGATIALLFIVLGAVYLPSSSDNSSGALAVLLVAVVVLTLTLAWCVKTRARR